MPDSENNKDQEIHFKNPIIDGYHFKITFIIQTLYNIANSNTEKVMFLSMFEILIVTIKYLFDTEEELIKNSTKEIKNFHIHLGKHEYFIHKINSIYHMMENTGKIDFYSIDYIKKWIKKHVIEYDSNLE